LAFNLQPPWRKFAFVLTVRVYSIRKMAMKSLRYQCFTSGV